MTAIRSYRLADRTVSAALPSHIDLLDGLSRLLVEAPEATRQQPSVAAQWNETQNCFLLSGDGLARSFTCAETLDAVCSVSAGLIGGYARASLDRLCFHAAAILHDGRAYLIPTTYSSGKSTLCLAWMEQGGQLITDDAAIFDIAGHTVSSFGIPLRIRTSLLNDGPSRLRDFALANAILRGQRLAYIRDPRHEAPPPGVSYPFGGWIFLSRQNGAATAMAPVSPEEALRRIIWQNFARSLQPSALLAIMTTLAADYPAWQLTYGESVDAVPVLRETLSAPIASRQANIAPVGDGTIQQAGAHRQAPDLKITETTAGLYVADDRNGRVYFFNPSAGVMWNLALAAASEDEAVDILHELYPVQDEATLGADYRGFLEGLVELQLLLPGSSAS